MSISVIQVFKDAFEIYKKHWIKYTFVLFAIYVIATILQAVMDSNMPAPISVYAAILAGKGLDLAVVAILGFVVSLLLGIIITAAILTYALYASRGHDMSLYELVEKTFDYRKILKLFGLYAIFIVAIFVFISIDIFLGTIASAVVSTSFILLIAFAVLFFVAPVLMIAYYLVLDKNKGVFSALAESVKITFSNFVPVMLFTFLYILVALSGILVFVVGLFFSITYAIIASAVFYQYLIGERNIALAHQEQGGKRQEQEQDNEAANTEGNNEPQEEAQDDNEEAGVEPEQHKNN